MLIKSTYTVSNQEIQQKSRGVCKYSDCQVSSHKFRRVSLQKDVLQSKFVDITAIKLTIFTTDDRNHHNNCFLSLRWYQDLEASRLFFWSVMDLKTKKKHIFLLESHRSELFYLKWIFIFAVKPWKIKKNRDTFFFLLFKEQDLNLFQDFRGNMGEFFKFVCKVGMQWEMQPSFLSCYAVYQSDTASWMRKKWDLSWSGFDWPAAIVSCRWPVVGKYWNSFGYWTTLLSHLLFSDCTLM